MFRLLYSFGYFSDFFISNSWKFRQLYLDLRIGQFVDISYIFYNFVLYEQINNTFSHSLDIHAILTHEMLDLLFRLFRAMRIDTIVMHIFLKDWFMA